MIGLYSNKKKKLTNFHKSS